MLHLLFGLSHCHFMCISIIKNQKTKINLVFIFHLPLQYCILFYLIFFKKIDLMKFLKIIFTLCMIFMSMISYAEIPIPISANTWSEVKLLSGISSSQDPGHKNNLYIFFDPNCHICARLISQDKSALERSLIDKPTTEGSASLTPTATWIPVAYMKPTSRDMAAAILRSQSFKAISKNFENFNFEKRQGFTIEVVPTTREINNLAQTKQVWSKLGGGTPMFVYQDKQGKYLKFIGIPPDVQLKEIFDQIAD